ATEGGDRNSLETPALAVLLAEVTVGLGTALRLHRRGVPVELLAGLVGDVPQQHRLRQRPGVIEIAERTLARALDRGHPLLVVAERLRDRRIRPLVLLVVRLRQQLVRAVVRD